MNSSLCTVTVTRADVVVMDLAADERWAAAQLFSMHQRGHMPAAQAIEPNKPPLTLRLVSFLVLAICTL
jgi:hypothetical protein